MSNGIKRYDLNTGSGMFPSEGGRWCVFTDHEADKAEAMAAKDAEIVKLKESVNRLQGLTVEDRGRLVEQVRERCAQICDTRSKIHNHGSVTAEFLGKAIRTADLTDLTGVK